MKYKVRATMVHEAIINTEDPDFVNYRKKRRVFFGKKLLDEKALVTDFAMREFSWYIIDDEGHGTITPLSFDWEVKEME